MFNCVCATEVQMKIKVYRATSNSGLVPTNVQLVGLIWMDEWMYGWISGWMNGCMDGYLDGRVNFKLIIFHHYF